MSVTKRMCGIGLMCVVITLCGWLTVPSAVPFTLQTLGIMLAVGLLGTKSGLLSVAVYLLLGLTGLPVFAGMQGGAGVFVGPAGGYLLGFLVMTLLSGLIMGPSQRPVRIVLALGAGLLADYAVGTLWYAVGYAGGNLWGSLLICVIPFLLPDALKLGFATLLIQKTRPLLTKMGWKRW